MVPLYSRIESIIKNKILTGQLEPGSKLPTEAELITRFGVSRITIRQALSRLETEGFIIRQRSKGTFVSDDIPTTKQIIFSGGVRDIISDSKRYETKPFGIQTMKVGETRAAKRVKDFFNLTKNDEINRIQRLRLLKGMPIYFLENYMPFDIAKHLSVKELSEEPLLELLKKKIGIKIERGEMYIEAIPVGPQIAKILKCQIYDPVVLIQIYYWFPSMKPFQHVDIFIRSDCFKYKIELYAKDF